MTRRITPCITHCITRCTTRCTRQRSITGPPGFTLLELLLALSVAAILAAVALPRTAELLDRIAVQSAAADAEAMLESARHIAMTVGEHTTVDVDTASATLSMRIGTDTLHKRDESALQRVRFRATRPSVTYTQLGMGFGVSNLTLVISRGAAAETVTVSRLGRVRR